MKCFCSRRQSAGDDELAHHVDGTRVETLVRWHLAPWHVLLNIYDTVDFFFKYFAEVEAIQENALRQFEILLDNNIISLCKTLL